MNRRRVMRLGRWIVLLLIGGAIANVAVAWTIVAQYFDGSRPEFMIESPTDQPSRLTNIAVSSVKTAIATRFEFFMNFKLIDDSPRVSDLEANVPRWAHAYLRQDELERLHR